MRISRRGVFYVCDQLLPQAYACAELINQWSFESSAAAGLLNDAGVYLYERGRYTDAEPLYQQALAIREKAPEGAEPLVARAKAIRANQKTTV